jgi:hypothetical protein
MNHFIFLSERRILQVCREYVNYYNGARPSQALQAIPDPYPDLLNSQTETGRVVAIPVLGGVQHDYRCAAWLLTYSSCLSRRPSLRVNQGT